VIREADTAKALALRDDYRKSVHELVAPDFFPYEVGNALTKAERQKVIKPPDGWAAWLTVMADAPVLINLAHLIPRAYAISSQFRSALFDCLYVALAEQENCEFITCDLRVIANLGPHFPLLKPLSSLP
jgi:predicted nucleic acid-binding protein